MNVHHHSRPQARQYPEHIVIHVAPRLGDMRGVEKKNVTRLQFVENLKRRVLQLQRDLAGLWRSLRPKTLPQRVEIRVDERQLHRSSEELFVGVEQQTRTEPAPHFHYSLRAELQQHRKQDRCVSRAEEGIVAVVPVWFLLRSRKRKQLMMSAQSLHPFDHPSAVKCHARGRTASGTLDGRYHVGVVNIDRRGIEVARRIAAPFVNRDLLRQCLHFRVKPNAMLLQLIAFDDQGMQGAVLWAPMFQNE